jgi:hypothetical protein
MSRLSGLAQTARGPVMATSMGKVVVDGISRVGDEDIFACRFLRARNQQFVGVPFFARYDENACWFDELHPAFGQQRFFFENDENIET